MALIAGEDCPDADAAIILLGETVLRLRAWLEAQAERARR